MLSVLITGATGVLGSELLRQARARPDWDTHGVSSSGGDGVLAWAIGSEPPPPPVRRRWDVIVHAAADTRWNLPVETAQARNVEPTAAAMELLGPDSRFVHVSTAFAGGLLGSTVSTDPADYRNTYEWSKAAAERLVRVRRPEALIVRPPLIIGRSTDGAVSRFSGLYTVITASVAGLLPVIVGDGAARVDIVPVDRVAQAIWERIDLPHQAATGAAPVRIGGGKHRLPLAAVVETAYAALNGWREERGLPALQPPPFVTPARWQRFYLPFVRPHLSERQLQALELLDHFRPYFSVPLDDEPEIVVDGVRDAVERSIRWWAEHKPTAASRTPEPWRLDAVGRTAG